MDRPFTLAPDAISHDTIEALKALLRDTERSEIIGLAFAVIYKGRDYIVNTAGKPIAAPRSRAGWFRHWMII